jgi:hypothetical protein
MGYVPRVGRGGKLKQTWSLLGHKKQILYHVLAADQNYTYAKLFTVNFSPELERESFDLRYRRVRLHLKRQLGRLPAIVVVEDTHNGRRHFHGVIGLHTKAEEALVEKALKTAGGEWASRCHKDKQIDLRPLRLRFHAWYMCRIYKKQVPWTATNVLLADAKKVHRMEIENSKLPSPENLRPDTQEAPITQRFPSVSRIPARRSPPLGYRPNPNPHHKSSLEPRPSDSDKTIIDDMDEIGLDGSDANDDLY